MLCLNYLTRGQRPLGPPLLLERPKSTFRNDWSKFCSIVPKIIYRMSFDIRSFYTTMHINLVLMENPKYTVLSKYRIIIREGRNLSEGLASRGLRLSINLFRDRSSANKPLLWRLLA